MKKSEKKYEEESFNARLQMEKTAQQYYNERLTDVERRLTAVEITVRNQGRIK